MEALTLTINPSAKVTWHPIGDYGTVVMQVDDFLLDPEAIRSLALSLAYSNPSSGQDYYPGLRSTVSLAGSIDLIHWVGERILENLFPKGDRPPEVSLQGGTGCLFCIKTINAKDVPANFHDQHSDGSAWIATVLHLSHSEEARGTAFWEHRPSGLQHCSRADPVMSRRLETRLGLRFSRQLDVAFVRGAPIFESSDIYSKLFVRKEGRTAFSAEEDEHWKLLKFVPARFNRLVAYPAWQIHSIVDESRVSNPSRENARLTMNQFLNYPFKREAVCCSPYPRSIYRPVEGLAIINGP